MLLPPRRKRWKEEEKHQDVTESSTSPAASSDLQVNDAVNAGPALTAIAAPPADSG